MLKPLFFAVSAGALLALACRSGDAPRKEASPAATQQEALEAPAGGSGILPDNVQWHSWEQGLARARAESKPIMVLVYADWCPKCRALGPVFASPEIAALARRFVMVQQDHDENPAWLAPFNEKYGGYVPRIFFFTSDGKIREDVTSGHPRYPYFYAASHADVLKRSMQQAIDS